jgi:integrase
VATINKIHKLADCKPLTDQPEVSSILKVIQEYSTNKKKQAKSVRYKQIQAVGVLINKDRLMDVRDCAILQFAYSTLLRRLEVAKIQVEHIEYDPEQRDGLVQIDKIKSKKGGRDTHYAYLSEDASFGLMRWLKVANITDGYIFRSLTKYEALRQSALDGRGIGSSINRMGLYLGDDRHFTGHSTRIGAAQDMVSSGIETTKAMNSGRWRDHKTFIGYVAKLNAKENGMAEFFKKQN